MAVTENKIPNLWGFSDLGVEVVTPREILEAQATYFEQMTKGLLLAEVDSEISDSGKVVHHLQIVAPTLGNVRYTLLSIESESDMPYPARVDHDPDNNKLTKYISDLDPDLYLKYSEREIRDEIKSALSSRKSTAIIQSLLSKIRETKIAA